MNPGSVKCCIEGCIRTSRRPDAGEWICGRHWHRIPRATRDAIRLASDRGKPQPAIDRLWARCKRLASIPAELDDIWRPK